MRAEGLRFCALAGPEGARSGLKVEGSGNGYLKKVPLAGQSRPGTTMPLAWIAQRLSMGSRGYLAWLLGQQGKRGKSATTPAEGQGLRQI